MPRKVLLIALGTLAFLVIGVVGMRLLMSLHQPPQRQAIEAPGKLVRVVSVMPQEVTLTIQGFGTVRAKTEWSVVPEVSGPLVQLSPQLRAGLHVKQGELLFEIDPRPYRLAVQRIRAQITELRQEIVLIEQQRRNHQATLRIAEGNLAIADEELRRDEVLVRKGTISARERDLRRQTRNAFANAVQATMNSLALIDPQRDKTAAAIAVAQAQLADAKLRLQKTRLLAPFDGQVVSSILDPGEFVQEGREVATLYDTSVVEIPITTPLDDLRWLPALSPETLRRGYLDPNQQTSLLPPATVYWQSADREYTWPGRLRRWEAGVDRETHTMTLVVEVPNPWRAFRPGQHPPLQPGMFCRVEVAATTVPHAIVIPRLALHQNQTVYLAQKGVLEIRPVQALRLLRDQAIITGGLRPGDQVVVSPLTTPVVGMKLRTLQATPPVSAPATAVSHSSPATVMARNPANQREER
jgi:RND family efflux transporter MFP subunit